MQISIYNWEQFTEQYPQIQYTQEQISEIIKNQFSDKDIHQVSIIFTESHQIKKLNKQFRHKDTPTDVLTFTLEEKPVSGEIYICPEYIKKNGYDSEEILRNIVHGLLHLLGYNHKGKFVGREDTKEEMFVKQENILDNIMYEINNRVR